MSNTIIKVENLAKSTLINHQPSERYTALRDVLTNNAKHLSRSTEPTAGCGCGAGWPVC